MSASGERPAILPTRSCRPIRSRLWTLDAGLLVFDPRALHRLSLAVSRLFAIRKCRLMENAFRRLKDFRRMRIRSIPGARPPWDGAGWRLEVGGWRLEGAETGTRGSSSVGRRRCGGAGQVLADPRQVPGALRQAPGASRAGHRPVPGRPRAGARRRPAGFRQVPGRCSGAEHAARRDGISSIHLYSLTFVQGSRTFGEGGAVGDAKRPRRSAIGKTGQSSP
jgi:hypothetical protein